MLLQLLFVLEGLLFCAAGVPLALGRVGPNSIFGFRTAKTLSDPAIWYAANRSVGIDLIGVGVVVMIGALLVPHFTGGRYVPTITADGVIVVGAVAVAVARSLWKLRRL
ncbi:MAG: hypothetical protein JWO87_2144 [Phycisphaerales bacterium]|nr:hypothetical protein [Phycisphaerales bacterium]